ncbi:type II methionyl aminopeptidase [Nanoarchaeota archaeon]
MNEQDKKDFFEAGRIAAEARELARKLIKPNTKVIDVLNQVEDFIKENKAQIAFPAQSSINQAAAHYCSGPEDETKYQEGQIVKIDLGVHINGWVADNASTVDLSEDNKYKKLIEASKSAVEKAIELVKPGIAVCKLGEVIEETIKKAGFKPVRNLSGHGIGKFTIHSKPSIPNYNNDDQYKLKAGETIAIEPFASTGSGIVDEKGQAEVFMVVNKRQVRNIITRQVLKEINKYEGLPFTTRWLTKTFSLPKVKLALNDLLKEKIIRAYPPLLDTDQGMISQHEDSLLVTEDGCEVSTKLQ